MILVRSFILVLAAASLLAGCYYPNPKLAAGQSASAPVPPADQMPDGWQTLPYSPHGVMPGDQLELLFHFRTQETAAYRIAVQDVLDVKFPSGAELNEQQKVRPDGMISLPFIGDVKVVGKSPQELTAELRKSYQPILNVPDVYVVVREYGSRLQEIRQSVSSSGQGQTKLVRVRRDGQATFPLLGEMSVGGTSVADLNRTLKARYQELDPGVEVDLSINAPAAAKVCILGAVNTPGCQPVDGPVTVLEAVGLAGGFKNDALMSTVICIRRDGDTMRYLAVDASSMLSGDSTAQYVLLPEHSVVFVSRTPLSQAADTADQLGKAFFFRGWGFTLGKNIDSY